MWEVPLTSPNREIFWGQNFKNFDLKTHCETSQFPIECKSEKFSTTFGSTQKLLEAEKEKVCLIFTE
jgi:hypothetical protein